MTARLIHADCIAAMREMEPNSVDAICTDPPYGLEFMGKQWDRLWNAPEEQHEYIGSDFVGGTRAQAWHHAWAVEALRVAKPGAHLLAFGGTRTYHRLACALEDAGWEIRDCILNVRGGDAAEPTGGLLAWLYGSGKPGFPKSLNVSRVLAQEGRTCQCQRGESAHGDGDPATEHDVRPVPDADVPEAVSARAGEGAVLLEGVSEHGTSELRTSRTEPEAPGSEQPSLEGRRDSQAPEGELLGGPLREGAAVGATDGPQGRLHHGAPAGDGADVRAVAVADGSGEPHRPQPVEQPPGQPGTLADERGPQAWRGWTFCARCGKPRVPDGLGTALKPAFEPIVVARKPLAERNVAANVLEHGTGALNIDGTRIDANGELIAAHHMTAGSSLMFTSADGMIHDGYRSGDAGAVTQSAGRWPANVVLGHSPDCDGDCAPDCAVRMLDEQAARQGLGRADWVRSGREFKGWQSVGELERRDAPAWAKADAGGASRFFAVIPAEDNELRFRYISKADREERERGLEHLTSRPVPFLHDDGRANPKPLSDPRMDREQIRNPARNHHPTVKPVALMQWLVRLVCPPGGTVLDPFTGSGSTGIAALREGFDFIGVEREAEYVAIAEARITGDAPLFNVVEVA